MASRATGRVRGDPGEADRRPRGAGRWVAAARPRTLVAALVPVAMGAAIASRSGAVDLVVACSAAACALLIQVATNFANDLFDFEKGADDADRLGPRRVVQAGDVTPAEMRRALSAVLGGAFLIGCYLSWLGGWPVVAIGTASLVFAVAYTGGPFPLAYHGAGDAAVFLFFGPLAVSGTTYLLSGSWPASAVLAGAGPGCLSAALLVINNLRDREGDERAGKRTLVVRLGESFGRAGYVTLLAAAALAPAAAVSRAPEVVPPAALLTSLVPLLLAGKVRAVRAGASGRELNGVLERTAVVLALYGAVFAFTTVAG